MTETAMHRRRWPWLVLVAALILMGGAIAWRFRPVNTAESAFVGRWVVNADWSFQFYRDHSVVTWSTSDVRTWSASERTLSISDGITFGDLAGLPWRVRLSTYFRHLRNPHSGEVIWDGPDRFWWKGDEFVRVSE